MQGAVYLVGWSVLPERGGLRVPERSLVAAALKHFHGERYSLLAYVVMDNHVHAVVRPLGEYTLASILHSWKSFTSHAINKRRHASGAFWVKDSYNRIIRSERDLHEKLNYVLTNPQRRWPEIKDYAWVELVGMW